MREDGCDEVILETEVTNKGALTLYENLGFVRDKVRKDHPRNGLGPCNCVFGVNLPCLYVMQYLYRYYLNNNSAFRLKVDLRPSISYSQSEPSQEQIQAKEETVPK